MAITFLLGLPLLCPIGSGTLCFDFHELPEPFYYLSYFCYDPLVIEHCIIQAPTISMFSAIVFVVEF
jgi:hypothetical protein